MVATLEDVASKVFDYVIIGGGTAGLTIAASLTEDTTVTVLVLEAGSSNLDDPKILLSGRFGATVGNPKYDWGHKTLPQKYCNNRIIEWSQGKGLGGTSTMNFWCWIKPPAGDVDAWQGLGNAGWGWKSFQKYSLRSERFIPETGRDPEGVSRDYIEHRGQSGRLITTVANTFTTLNTTFFETAGNLGIPLIADPYGGYTSGAWTAATSMDPRSNWTKSYAATASYIPVAGRQNFTVLTEAICTRVIFSDAKIDDKLVATGVKFIHVSRVCTVNARKEVICSAGTIKTPQILELSGIGSRDVLRRIGVPLKIELPGVGENVQDHVIIGSAMKLKETSGIEETFDSLRDPEFAREQVRLMELGEPNLHRYAFNAFSYTSLSLVSPDEAESYIQRVNRRVQELKTTDRLPPGRAEQYEIQIRALKDNQNPDLQIVAYPGFLSYSALPDASTRYVSLFCVLNHPLSRGTIHSISDNPLDSPEIDPHYFEDPLDLELFAQNLKFARKFAETEPFKSIVASGVDTVMNYTSDEELLEFTRNTARSAGHAIGSASMLPRDKNGVVDPDLRVYGTANLRIADLSIVPLHVAAHTQSLAYAIGEKLADLLKGSK
ncbi:hypothetical protein CERSUDRAFT_105302 [Gelatoporia subvermispora B]|uniref:Glucose-methanol-choline oxidoreductase N-terminal domain-containing protein n=1 Tax=Ceriporiopsis subvermispora (strain B) TaxID=914234 RepID=M2QYN2_CERS8|nr:hypothetical protein CERSUDRAFT_105302 [Gelatoporia subvermispora B]